MKTVARALAAIAVLAAGSAPAYAEWPSESIEIGARDHAQVLQQHGGETPDAALSEYLRQIGGKIVAVSDRPDEDWTFTLLDSPQVNAFALPGGYVYVTRGLMTLAHNEAQLAAVLSHEITHVIEAHVESRQEANKDALIDGAVGALLGGLFGGNTLEESIREGVETAVGSMGSYSRAQEYDADEGGIALLLAAGYDPNAQADFLALMAANSALSAVIAQREFDPENVPFFANHPAPQERLDKARQLAGQGSGERGAEPYLTMIDGMQYGETMRQGFMRGRNFIHPALGFTFELANGLRVQNTATQVNISGPRRSTLILSGDRLQDGALDDYIRGWARQIPARDRIGRSISDLHEHRINGLPAATGTIRLRRQARRGKLQMTVIRFNDRLYRFAGFSADRDDRTRALLNQVVESFRPLSDAEIGQFQGAIIRIHQVQTGDTVDSLAALFSSQEYAVERFRLLNGMSDSDRLNVGGLVKLIIVESAD